MKQRKRSLPKACTESSYTAAVAADVTDTTVTAADAKAVIVVKATVMTADADATKPSG